MQALGAEVEGAGPDAIEPTIRDRGVGLRGARSAAIDVGNAGTLLRLLPGWLAGQPQGSWTLDGDDSIRRRPVDRIADPLREMGAKLSCREDRLPPLRGRGRAAEGNLLRAAGRQRPGQVLPAASPGCSAEGETWVGEPLREPRPHRADARGRRSRRHLARGEASRFGRPRAWSRATWRSRRTSPRRPSSSSRRCSFPAARSSCRGGRQPDPDRPARRSSSGWAPRSRWRSNGPASTADEPIATIRARATELRGTEVGGKEIPLAIDELPLVALAACFAEGETTIRDAAELRRKESDRIATICEALAALGATVEAREDGMRIEGGGGLRGGAIDAHGDHRIAMLGAIAGLASREGVEVEGMEAAAISYPGFESDLASLLGRSG